MSTKTEYHTLIDKAIWNDLRKLLAGATIHPIVDEVAKAIVETTDGYEAILLLSNPKPPRWWKGFFYTAAVEVFGKSSAFMLVWFIFLEWRNAMSGGMSNKYKLYQAERGVRNELTRLLRMSGGTRGETPSKEVKTLAARHIATSMQYLWAGLPRPEWYGKGVVMAEFKLNDSGKPSHDSRWANVMRAINESGVAPRDAGMTDDEVMALAVALSSGDTDEIERLHTGVTQRWTQ
jgi:hypothetical protein